MKVKPSSSAALDNELVEFSLIDEDDDLVEFSLIDEDDDILMQADKNETEAQDDEGAIDLDGINFDEAMLEEEDLGNVSIGVDSNVQNTFDEDCVTGFDTVTGSLWIYPTNYPVRDYQYNIVQQALFKNTLVVLPTGLGKTFIAAVVMYNLYRWFPQGKIVFMAPTKPLVTQQMNACYNIMGIPVADTIEMTGSLPPNVRRIAWREKRVVFLTPQVMMNDMCRGSCAAESIKCIVVDEAHKALRNHAYCQVIRELVKYTRQFRVLALSATPGSDLKSVQQVMNNLLISHIELRSEESIDIQPYTHERKVEKVVVPMGEEISGVREQYIQVMTYVIHRLIQNKVLYRREATKFSKFLLLKARDEFRQNPPQVMQKAQFGNIEADFALAISLYHGFELLQLHGMKSLYNYLMGLITGEKGYGRTRSELLRNADFNIIMEKLRLKFIDSEQTSTSGDNKLAVGHPKMQRLEEIVVKHFKDFEKKSLETRVMIFSQYRDSVHQITSILNQHQPLVKVMPFIGQASVGKGTKGYTQKEQLMVMKQFREGGYNTLVATCVGEEGLDIGDVDLIVCFDAHKSPIRLVQRMGRTGRKRQGRIVMLVTEGKEEQIYNQSQYSKKAIHKAILNAAKSLHFYPNNPRLVPASLKPQCHKMHITVSASPAASSKKNLNIRKSTGKLPDFFSKKMKISNENELITREEYDLIKEEFAMIPTLAKFIPRPKCICLTSNKKNRLSSDSSPTINFAEWMPWQNRLQKTFLIGHSIQSLHLVEDYKFIELQQAIGDSDDFYGQEMSRIGKVREKRLGQSSIVSFLNTSQCRSDPVVEAPAPYLSSTDVVVVEPILIGSESGSEEDKRKDSKVSVNKKVKKGKPARLTKARKKKILTQSTPKNSPVGKKIKAKLKVGVRKHAEKHLAQSQLKKVSECKRSELGVQPEARRPETEKPHIFQSRSLQNLNTVCELIHDVCIEEAADVELVQDDERDVNTRRSAAVKRNEPTSSNQIILVPPPPDISELKYLFSDIKSRSDFADIDLEKLMAEWDKSEAKSCEDMSTSLHLDLLLADRPPTCKITTDPPVVSCTSPKLNRTEISVEVGDRKEPAQAQVPDPLLSPRSPLFKSLTGKKMKKVNKMQVLKREEKTPVSKDTAAESLVSKTLKHSSLEQKFEADFLFKKQDKTNERSKAKDASDPSPLSTSEASTDCKPSRIADDALFAESFFSEPLDISHSMKLKEAAASLGASNVSSFLTYTQAMDCFDSSSSEGLIEHTDPSASDDQVAKSDLAHHFAHYSPPVSFRRSSAGCLDILGNEINQQKSPFEANSRKNSSGVKSPFKTMSRNNSSGFSVSRCQPESDCFIMECNKTDQCPVSLVDLNETPQFDLGFDLEDEEAILSCEQTSQSSAAGDSMKCAVPLPVSADQTSAIHASQLAFATLLKSKVHSPPGLKIDKRAEFSDSSLKNTNEVNWKPINNNNSNVVISHDSPMSPESADDSVIFDTPEKSEKKSANEAQSNFFSTSVLGSRSRIISGKRDSGIGTTNVFSHSKSFDESEPPLAPVLDVSDEEETIPSATSLKVPQIPFDTYASSQQDSIPLLCRCTSDNKVDLPNQTNTFQMKKSRLSLGEKKERLYEPLIARTSCQPMCATVNHHSNIPVASQTKVTTENILLKPKFRDKKTRNNLFDFDCDEDKEVKASTPLKLPPANEMTSVDVTMNLTPIEKIHKVYQTEEKDNCHDSFIIRRRKKLTSAVLNTSSDCDEKNQSNVSKGSDSSRSSLSDQRLKFLLHSDNSDNEFDYEGNLSLDKMRLKKVKKVQGQKSTKLKARRTRIDMGKAYLEEEAEVSGDEISSDEREDLEDHYEASFIDNNTELIHSQAADMQAVYLKSVKSPQLNGRFKLMYNKERNCNFDVYSQELSEDHGDSEYEEDSFCVGSDDIESSIAEEESRHIKFTKISKKARGSKKSAGKRIMVMCDSTSDDDEEGQNVLTQEFTVGDKINARKILSSSEDEADRKSANNLKNASEHNRHSDNSGSSQKQGWLSKKVSATSTVTPVETQVGHAAEKLDLKAGTGDGINFHLLEEADWFDDDDFLDHATTEGAAVKANAGNGCVSPPLQLDENLPRKVVSPSTSPKMNSKNNSDIFKNNSSTGMGCSRNSSFSSPSQGLTASINKVNCLDGITSGWDAGNGKKKMESVSSAGASQSKRNLSSSSNSSTGCGNAISFIPQPVSEAASDGFLNSYTRLNKVPMTREERLLKQKEKQEKFQLKLKQVQQCTAAQNISSRDPVGSSYLTSDPNNSISSSETSFDKSDLSTSNTNVSYNHTKHSSELQILVDSREISVAQNIISALRVKHGINVTAWQISSCDYILSNHLAADRLLWSSFSNSSNSSKLSARLCEIQSLYDRCVLIIEADPVKPGQGKSKKNWNRTKYVDTTLSYLTQTRIKIYFTDTTEETALLLSELCYIEEKKGRSLNVPTTLTSRQEEVMKFILQIPNMIIPQALNIIHHFRSLTEFLNSSSSLIQEKCRMSLTSAEAIHQFICHEFDLQMLPNTK
ncbi:hypothetical protein Btru_056611 [Bulinus truncatus]|nr:hypothetical protein Btru_056611 [Bulinus truncatus]